MISAVNNCHHKKKHNFGIRIPKNTQEAHAIDKENDNNLWDDAMAKDMSNVRIAFRLMKSGELAPVGYQFNRCHVIWDVNLDSLKLNFRLVAGGDMAEAPVSITYVSAVSRKSVRIALEIAALHDLEVKAADIMNAYPTAPNADKTWTVLGPEFGEYDVKKALIVQDL